MRGGLRIRPKAEQRGKRARNYAAPDASKPPQDRRQSASAEVKPTA
ncbi:hypothetical protein [Treponema endosymbiont of Eucomonympha sp.]|nr:hypothetical protein [Treponema endosymbiont of Eucomonympha sp.]